MMLKYLSNLPNTPGKGLGPSQLTGILSFLISLPSIWPKASTKVELTCSQAGRVVCEGDGRLEGRKVVGVLDGWLEGDRVGHFPKSTSTPYSHGRTTWGGSRLEKKPTRMKSDPG